MVEVNPKWSLRKQQQQARLARMREFRVPGVRVTPASEELRAVLKHPTAGAFRAEGSTEWPNDRFTKRRLAEGSVKLEEAAPEQPKSRYRRADTDTAA